MRILSFVIASTLLVSGAMAQTQADPEVASRVVPKPLVSATSHMIVAAHPLAAQTGDEILAQGGSAADAAIATLLVLNVVEPQSSGIGGGAFALVHGPGGLTTWDARETAPAGATPDMFMDGGETLPFLEAVASGRSVGVPGLVRLMEALHDRHGKLPWADLFRPAITLAADGFEVSPRLASSIERFAGRLTGTDAALTFLPGGTSLSEGDLFRQPELAETFRRIADKGADAFYQGPIAEAIITTVTADPRPGSLSAADLSGYGVTERAPVCAPYSGNRVCGMGPPSSGATTVSQILGLIERSIPAQPAAEGLAVLPWHLFAEASRLAYADRAKYLADSDFVKVPVEGLLDNTYLGSRAALIDPAKAASGKAEAGDPPWKEGRYYAPDNSEDLPGTTHLSVIDKDGLAISLTASIETAFGSGRMAGGFLLNNQLTDFSFRPTNAEGEPIANAVAPGKRPRSSMAPTMAYVGERLAVITGSPGGSRIPEYVAQSLLGVMSIGVDPAEAVAWPHISQRNRGTLVLEPGFPKPIAETLGRMGHATERKDMTSGLHMITIGGNGTLYGGADPRREGVAIGR
jgi:gamma-glutamyltranspeptidase/glutathione hydrolase